MSFTLYHLLSFFGLFISSHQSSSLFLFVSNQNVFSFLSSDAAALPPLPHTPDGLQSVWRLPAAADANDACVCSNGGFRLGGSDELTMFDKLWRKCGAVELLGAVERIPCWVGAVLV